MIHGRRAKTLLGLLDGTPPAGDDWLQQIERVRALRCTDDRVFQTYSEELMLESLLQANPRNKMAFEYLMAFYLVSRRTDKLVENLHRLDDFGYREIPRHYEEAILIHANETAQQVALHGRAIRPETIQRFHRFIDRVRPWQNQPHAGGRRIGRRIRRQLLLLLRFRHLGNGRIADEAPNPPGPLADASGYGVAGTGGAR